MRRLGHTVSRLTALSRALQHSTIALDDGRLSEMRSFGSNPGALTARIYVPENLLASAPLVVVLHGCTQSASIYDKGSGWSKLADRHGFALLFPEQRRANNSNLCFNWYVPGDARRGRGETLSISQMVEHMAAEHKLDRSRIFVTGLSAGGAMTSVMLAAYPELFAGGAIIAGLPFATANTLPEALERMRGHGVPPRKELAALAQAAAPHTGEAPSLSVWHGTGDMIVDAANSDAIVDQWRDLHGLGDTNGLVEIVDGHRREVWRNGQGRAVIEKYEIKGMGHGTPLDTRGGEACGIAGPHMLDANICSTRRIANFWGLTAQDVKREPMPARAARVAVPLRVGSTPITMSRSRPVKLAIEDALRAAGLLR